MNKMKLVLFIQRYSYLSTLFVLTDLNAYVFKSNHGFKTSYIRQHLTLRKLKNETVSTSEHIRSSSPNNNPTGSERSYSRWGK